MTDDTQTIETNLLDETVELLNTRKHSVKITAIAKAIGKSKAWVHLVANGKITNPGYQTLLKLNNYLKQELK